MGLLKIFDGFVPIVGKPTTVDEITKELESLKRCIECGWNFNIKNIEDGEVVSCPRCGSEYKLVKNLNGSITLEEIELEDLEDEP